MQLAHDLQLKLLPKPAVVGPEARAAYGLALGNRKAKKATDEAQAKQLAEIMDSGPRARAALIDLMVLNLPISFLRQTVDELQRA